MSKVLVVEDDGSVRQRLVSILEQSERYQPLEALDGRVALQMILAENPDFVLLDYDLPELSGVEVLQALEYVFEDRPELSKVMIIAMTSKQGGWRRHEVEHRFIADYLPNSCDAYRLIRTLDNLAKSKEHKAKVEAERYKKQGIKMLFSSIMEITQEGFLLINRQGTISYANAAAAKLLGFPSDQNLYGEPIGSILGPELAEIIVGNQQSPSLIADISRKTVRLSRFRNDRESILNFTLYPYHGPDGNDGGIIFHIRDLELLRQELERDGVTLQQRALPASPK